MLSFHFINESLAFDCLLESGGEGAPNEFGSNSRLGGNPQIGISSTAFDIAPT